MIKPEIYKFFADYIYKKSGMLYQEKDYYRLDSRLKELTRVFEKSSVEEIYDLYKGPITPDMNAVLINISTNNETYFFRDNHPFEALSSHMIPETLKKYSNETIKIWSCAASTGQEALSILMTIDQKCPPSAFDKVQIDASDISSDALSKGIKGKYNGLDVQRGLPITTLMKYFDQDGDDWKVEHRLLSKIKFFEFNLLTDHFANQIYHIIFCRNVLIYQDKENKNVILNRLYNSLKPGGFLVLGSGESLIGMTTQFEKVSLDKQTIYKRPVS